MSSIWIATENIYIDADGNVVDRKDSRVNSLLVRAGASIPLVQAVALGLAESGDSPALEVADDLPEETTEDESEATPEPELPPVVEVTKSVRGPRKVKA